MSLSTAIPSLYIYTERKLVEFLKYSSILSVYPVNLGVPHWRQIL